VYLKILQAGHPVLRATARPLSVDEIRTPETQRLIDLMRETMRDAPGVGLAAPQIGESLQLVVIEDASERMEVYSTDDLDLRDRRPVPFHVLINPKITTDDPALAEFFEGCLSVHGFSAIVPRAVGVKVEALDHHANPVSISARGWYARILQHEIDHLHGTLCIDRMYTRSLTTFENQGRFWRNATPEETMDALEIKPAIARKKKR
jgi:peptide deformylase